MSEPSTHLQRAERAPRAAYDYSKGEARAARRMEAGRVLQEVPFLPPCPDCGGALYALGDPPKLHCQHCTVTATPSLGPRPRTTGTPRYVEQEVPPPPPPDPLAHSWATRRRPDPLARRGPGPFTGDDGPFAPTPTADHIRGFSKAAMARRKTAAA